MGVLMSFINALYFIIGFIKGHFIISLLIVGAIILLVTRKNIKEAKTFLSNKFGMIILDGAFGKGKNRFMTNLSKESKEFGFIILSNYYNSDVDIRWNSLTDLKNLLLDMWKIGEYQNFGEEDIKEMYHGEGKERVKEKLKNRKEMKQKYKFIPTNGFYNKFLLLGDEFQNLFFNRGAMGNFTETNKGFLKLLHQVRHFNTLCIFATQNAQELDVKFRRLSTFYITVFDKLKGFLYGYYVYSFTVDKENNLDLEKAMKYTKMPAIFINLYVLNKIINSIEKIIRRKINYRFKQLKFFSKFNADPDYDIYTPGTLLEYINNMYKDKHINYKTEII